MFQPLEDSEAQAALWQDFALRNPPRGYELDVWQEQLEWLLLEACSPPLPALILATLESDKAVEIAEGMRCVYVVRRLEQIKQHGELLHVSDEAQDFLDLVRLETTTWFWRETYLEYVNRNFFML